MWGCTYFYSSFATIFCQIPQIKKLRIIYRGYAEFTVAYSSCHRECWSAQLSVRHRRSLAEYNLGFPLPPEVGKQARDAWGSMSLLQVWETDESASCFYQMLLFLQWMNGLSCPAGEAPRDARVSVTSFSEWPFVAHLSYVFRAGSVHPDPGCFRGMQWQTVCLHVYYPRQKQCFSCFGLLLVSFPSSQCTWCFTRKFQL